MNKIILFLCTMFFAFLLSTSVFAATSASIADSDASDLLQRFSGDGLNAPYGKDNIGNEDISTLSGSLSMESIDLKIPGRNNHDVIIKRVYNNQYTNKQYYKEVQETTFKKNERPAYSYYYISPKDGSKKYVLVLFNSESDMLELNNTNNSFYGATEDELYDYRKDHYDYYDHSVKYYRYNQMKGGLVQYIRDANIEPIYPYILSYQNVDFSNNIEDNYYQIGYNWRVDLPFISDGVISTYSSDTHDAVSKYGVFNNGEGNKYSCVTRESWNNIDEWQPYDFRLLNDSAYGRDLYKLSILSSNDTTDSTGISYNRTIKDKFGRMMYFNKSGKIVAWDDKYGNRIKYEYLDGQLTKIIDTYGKEIIFSCQNGLINAITFGNKQILYTKNVQYINSQNPSATPPPGLHTVLDYQLVVTDSENNITKYNSILRDIKWIEESESNINSQCAFLTKSYDIANIEYATGAKTEYNYNNYIINFSDYLPGSDTFTRNKYKIYTRRDFSNNIEYNKYTYSYNIPNIIINDRVYNRTSEGTSIKELFRSYGGSYDKDWESSYKFNYNPCNYKTTGTIIRDKDGYTIADSYNFKGQKFSTTEVGNDGCKREKIFENKYNANISHGILNISYIYETSSPIYKTIENTYQNSLSNNKISKEIITDYDFNYNLLLITKEDLTLTYTYDTNYSLMLTKEYKRDDSYSVKVVNEITPPTPKVTTSLNSIDNTCTYENNGNNDILKSKSKFIYDGYGNVVAEYIWVNDSNSDGKLDDVDPQIIVHSIYTYNSDKTYTVYKYIENVKDADGKTITFDDGTHIKDSNGNDINTYKIGMLYSYDYYGNLISVKDGKGNITTFDYDKLNRPKTQTFQDTTTKKIEYNTQDNYIISTDENVNQIKYQFDGLGNLTGKYINKPLPSPTASPLPSDTPSTSPSSEPLPSPTPNWQQLESYDYNVIGQKQTQTYYRKYNDAGIATETFTTIFEYYSDGQIKSEITNDITNKVVGGNTYKYEHNIQTKVTITPIGDSTITPAPISKYFDNMDRLVSEEVLHKENGEDKPYIVTYTYDYVGNKTSIKEPRSYDEAWMNTPAPSCTPTPLNVTTTYEYNYANQVVKETNALGKFITTDYDCMGRIVSKTDFKENRTIFTYDDMSRLIETDAPFDGTTRSKTKTYYDNNSNVIKQKSLSNKPKETDKYNIIEFQYDIKNRLEAVINHDTTIEGERQYVTQYAYDSGGRKKRMLTGLTAVLPDPYIEPTATNNFAVTSYEYNYLNQMTELTDPMSKTIKYTYDLVGNPIEITDRLNLKTTYTYNSFNKPVDVKVTKDGTTQTKFFTYDILGNCKTATNAGESGKISYDYDDLSRLEKETSPLDIIKTYTYDANNNRKTLKLTKGEEKPIDTIYTYDRLNRLENVYENGTDAGYTYDDNGNRDTLTVGNINTKYLYNDANLLTNLNNKKGTESLSQYSYTYYLNGNQESKNDMSNEVFTSYTYDGLGRLKGETVGNETVSYKYDLFHNRNSKKSMTGEMVNYETIYNYNKNNWLLKESKQIGNDKEVIDYTYDNNGNQIYKAKSKLSLTTGVESLGISIAGTNSDSLASFYKYDGFNQLTNAVENDKTINYTYNANGLRISKCINGVITNHIWDGANMVAETDGTGAVTAKYLRGINLLFSEGTTGANSRKCYLYNGHGDTTQLTDNSGSVIMNYEYDAFGNEKNPNVNDNNPFRYCGEYFDKETGSIYLRARYYSPSTGRFMQEDPIRDGLNWYTYCVNNPINLVDMLGLAPGDLQVNGNNIGYTKAINNSMYGSVRDYVNAIGGSISDDGSGLYTVSVGKNTFTIDNLETSNGMMRDTSMYNDKGKVIGKMSYTKVDDGTNTGTSKLLVNLQGMVDISDSKVSSLAYELGAEGGEYVASDNISKVDKNYLLPTSKAINKVREIRGSDALQDAINGGSSNAQIGGYMALAMADLITIKNAEDNGIPFINFHEKSVFFQGSTDTLINNNGNYFKLSNNTVGVFTNTK